MCRKTSFRYVWQFQSVAFLLVHGFQHEAQDEGGHAQAGQHDEGCGVVVGHGGFLGGDEAVLQVGHQLRVSAVEHFADEQREEPQPDVLYPEDECIGTADDFRIY